MAAASTALNKQHSILDHVPSNSATGDVEMGLSQAADQRGRTNHTGHNLVVARNTERTRLVVFGIMKISRVRLLAMLSGLRLESEIVSLHTSLTYKEKVRSFLPSLIPTHPPPQVIFNQYLCTEKRMVIQLVSEQSVTRLANSIRNYAYYEIEVNNISSFHSDD